MCIDICTRQEKGTELCLFHVVYCKSQCGSSKKYAQEDKDKRAATAHGRGWRPRERGATTLREAAGGRDTNGPRAALPRRRSLLALAKHELNWKSTAHPLYRKFC